MERIRKHRKIMERIKDNTRKMLERRKKMENEIEEGGKLKTGLKMVNG